jgi:hypothetical protein
MSPLKRMQPQQISSLLGIYFLGGKKTAKTEYFVEIHDRHPTLNSDYLLVDI